MLLNVYCFVVYCKEVEINIVKSVRKKIYNFRKKRFYQINLDTCSLEIDKIITLTNYDKNIYHCAPIIFRK